MKKYYSLILILLSLLFLLNIEIKGKADGGEEILYKYGTNTPITYYGTANPVTIPTTRHNTKQELRGVWVATIWNLDMPVHTSQTQYKAEFNKILDTLEDYNMNAIFFQVRPNNDAMYESQLNPWSRFLTGTEGVNPGWDPLPWMIEESHKRGIEFHAWFNPFRVFVAGLSTNNYASVHPEYVIYPGAAGNEILNPGEPAVRQHIIDTVMEVANKYDIDGVHFDDYFYPYGGLTYDKDAFQYNKYNPLELSVADWRRENVNDVVRRVKEGLTQVNKDNYKSIQFGISPFGVWAHKSSNSLGSNTANGVQSYFDLFADSLRWIKEEWIDYIIPQVYWEFTEPNAQYADVVKWWVDQVKGTNVNLYIGNSIYRYEENGWNSGPWTDPYEIDHQLLYNSKFSEITGSVYFRYKYLVDETNSNLVNARNRIKQSFYQFDVLTPTVKNVDSVEPNPPQNLTLNKNALTWNIVQMLMHITFIIIVKSLLSYKILKKY